MHKAMFLRRMEKQAAIAALAHHVVAEFIIPRRKGSKVQPSETQYFFFTLIFKSIHIWRSTQESQLELPFHKSLFVGLSMSSPAASSQL